MPRPSRPSSDRSGRVEEVRKSLLFIAQRWRVAARRRDSRRAPPYGEATPLEMARMRRALRLGTTQYLADTLPSSYAERFEQATSATPHAWGADRAWRCLVKMALEVRERDVA